VKVLDTDVCIEILRVNRRVLEARRRTQVQVATTWITACELSYGAAKSRDPEGNRALVSELLASLPVLGLDLAASQLYGTHKARLRRYYCDVLRQLFGGQHDPMIEEALAVAWARRAIIGERGQ